MSLLLKDKNKVKWFDEEYPCSNQVLTNTLINKMVNRLWLEKFKDVDNSTEYLSVMFRVRLAESREIKSITKLQRLRFESKEYLKSFIDLKAFMLQEFYSNAPVSGLIFSYSINKFSKLRNDFIDTVYAEMGPVKTEAIFHHYKNYKLPYSTDLNKYGKILLDTPHVKFIVLDNKTNLNVRIEEREGLTYYLIDYIKNNKVKLSWEDKILNKDHLVRIIGKTTVEYKDNSFVSIKTIRNFQKIKKVKAQNKINNNFIAGDLETILNKDNIMEPYLASFFQKGISGYEIDLNVDLLFSSYFKRLLSRKNRGFDIYFHNLSGFDGFFILRYLIKFGYKISPLMHSGKLIQIDINKGRNSWSIKDSNLILLQSLNKLARAFNLSINKGLFPYFLSDINYSGEYPNYHFFNQDKIKEEEYNLEKEKFKETKWNFKKEAIKYCLNDSKILFNILESFNKLIFERFSLNIHKYPTTPSLAFAIFRSKYLP
jgi:DNA polymerase type B, organellar and viral